MTRPLLNILIRTSNRPNYFHRLIHNIENQSYKNYRLIISADTPETKRYVERAGYNHTPVIRLSRNKNQTFPWNLYLNTLMDQVTEGWIMFMDDDDLYADNTAFELITAFLGDENSMLVWRLCFPDGRHVPALDYMGKTPFTRKQIAMPCFAFHSKWKNRVRFDGQRAGDFRMANQLQQFLKVIWLDHALVMLDNFGNVGRTVDLKN